MDREGMYFSFFYRLWFTEERSLDVSEEQLGTARDQDLNFNEEVSLGEDSKKHWKETME